MTTLLTQLSKLRWFRAADAARSHPPLRTSRLASGTSLAPQVEWAACVVGRETIDEINILQATMRAMEGAVAKLPNGCDRVLVRRCAEKQCCSFPLSLLFALMCPSVSPSRAAMRVPYVSASINLLVPPHFCYNLPLTGGRP